MSGVHSVTVVPKSTAQFGEVPYRRARCLCGCGVAYRRRLATEHGEAATVQDALDSAESLQLWQ